MATVRQRRDGGGSEVIRVMRREERRRPHHQRPVEVGAASLHHCLAATVGAERTGLVALETSGRQPSPAKTRLLETLRQAIPLLEHALARTMSVIAYTFTRQPLMFPSSAKRIMAWAIGAGGCYLHDAIRSGCSDDGSAASLKPSSVQPAIPPAMIFTGRPSRASRSAPRAVPLQCGPAQCITNSVSAAQTASLLAMILPCGRLPFCFAREVAIH